MPLPHPHSWSGTPTPTTPAPPSLSRSHTPRPSPHPHQNFALLPRVSEILPGLYIGDLSAAETPALLASLGITHILSAMRGHVAVLGCPPGIKRHQIPLDDLPFSELAAHLPGTTAFLLEALRDPRARVLVHCVVGVSRSASVVAAYLMVRFAWSVERAVAFVKTKREVDPNFGFLKQLEEFAGSGEGRRLAHEATAAAAAAPPPPPIGSGAS